LPFEAMMKGCVLEFRGDEKEKEVEKEEYELSSFYQAGPRVKAEPEAGGWRLSFEAIMDGM